MAVPGFQLWGGVGLNPRGEHFPFSSGKISDDLIESSVRKSWKCFSFACKNLKKDGLFIVSTPNSWPLSIAPFHTKEYDLDEFKRVLETKFEIESIYNQNSGTPWKYNHNEKRGIVVTTDENKNLAECFIAVCKKK